MTTLMQDIRTPTPKTLSMTERDITRWRDYSATTAKGFGIKGDDVDEVTQECLLDIYRCWDWPTGDKADYMGTVVKNRCLMWLNKSNRIRRHETSITPHDLEHSVIGSALDADTIIDHAVCHETIDGLNARDQRIIRLYGLGCPDSEIATTLGITVGDVKVTVARVRRQLRRMCSDNDS